MGLFENFPYTNFHRTNLDWLMQKTKENSAALDDLPETITETVLDMASEGLLPIPESYWRNVQDFIDEPLTGDNLGAAFQAAADKGEYCLYIPAGQYINPRIKITSETHVKCYPGVEILVNQAQSDHVITATNTVLTWEGGLFRITNGVADNVLLNNGGFNTAVFYLSGCRDSVISGCSCDRNKLPRFVGMLNCVHCYIRMLTIRNQLGAAIYLGDTCQDITVEHNTFTNIDKAVDAVSSSLYDYCYAVYTGVSGTDFVVPANNLIYRNNFISDSEDCGLDSHGAQNVIIENNRILNTVNAITAYNDNARNRRPAGWVMCNIRIANNYCVSTKDIPSGTAYPHPYIFVGASNIYSELLDNPYIPGSYGTPYDFADCEICNNYIDTVNSGAGATYSREIIYAAGSKNLNIHDNTFRCHSVNIPFKPARALSFRFENNTVIEPYANPITAEGSSGEIASNTGFTILSAPSALAVIETDGRIANPTLARRGLYFESFNSTAAVLKGVEIGKHPNQGSGSIIAAAVSFTVQVADGICRITAMPVAGDAQTVRRWMIPEGTALSLTAGGQSYNVYVGPYVSNNSFYILDAAGAINTSPNGNGSFDFRTLTRTTV